MPRATFLSCALILPALFASAIVGQFDFGTESTVTDNAQIPLGHHDDYGLVCNNISLSISPASQVFYPGAVFAFLSEPLPTTYVDPQILPNSWKTSLIGSTRVHRYPRVPCGLARLRTSARPFVI